MSDLDKRIADAPPISAEEAQRKLNEIGEKIKELDGQSIEIQLDPVPLSEIVRRYVEPVLQAIKRMQR